jgi:hypothetical protein
MMVDLEAELEEQHAVARNAYLRFTTAGEILRRRGLSPTVTQTAEVANKEAFGVLTVSLARIHEIYGILQPVDVKEPNRQRAPRYSSDLRRGYS